MSKPALKAVVGAKNHSAHFRRGRGNKGRKRRKEMEMEMEIKMETKGKIFSVRRLLFRAIHSNNVI